MSDQEQTKTPDEIREEIEQTREELGETVEALGAKTDVKGRAQEKVDAVKADAHATAQEVKSDPVGTAKRNPAPFAAAAALLVLLIVWRRRGN